MVRRLLRTTGGAPGIRRCAYYGVMQATSLRVDRLDEMKIAIAQAISVCRTHPDTVEQEKSWQTTEQ